MTRITWAIEWNHSLEISGGKKEGEKSQATKLFRKKNRVKRTREGGGKKEKWSVQKMTEKRTKRARQRENRDEDECRPSVHITRINVRWDAEERHGRPTGIGWHLVETLDRLGQASSRPSFGRPSLCPTSFCPRQSLGPDREGTVDWTRGSSCTSVGARLCSVRPWTGPVWSMPLTRTKDGEAPRLGTDVLLSRNAVVELRSGALESVRARWQTLFRASCLPFTPAIGVGWSESTNVPLICTNSEL